MPQDIPGAIVKVIELVGSSPSSFSDAVRNAVRAASKTIRNIRGVDVVSSTAEVGEDGEIAVYKVACKLSFIVEEPAPSEALGSDLSELAARQPAEPPYVESGPDTDR
jgi:flavin-binding protein dodecin